MFVIVDNGGQYGATYSIVGDSNNNGYAGVTTQYASIYGTKVTGEVRFPIGEQLVKKLQIVEMKDQGLRCLNVPVSASGR